MTSLDSPHYTTTKRTIVKYEGGMYYVTPQDGPRNINK